MLKQRLVNSSILGLWLEYFFHLGKKRWLRCLSHQLNHGQVNFLRVATKKTLVDLTGTHTCSVRLTTFFSMSYNNIFSISLQFWDSKQRSILPQVSLVDYKSSLLYIYYKHSDCRKTGSQHSTEDSIGNIKKQQKKSKL